MKNETKKTLAWILIVVPAFYIAYHAIINGAFSGNSLHLWVFISVIVWLIGDYLLSQTKK